MGAQSKPPLPAPTDTSVLSSGDNTSLLPEDLATDISRVTDKTSFSIPEDGSPVTITTTKVPRGDSGRELSRRNHHSQTSLLIEYWEAGKTKDGSIQSRPSVRVRVTPSSAKKNRVAAHDHIQITETGKNRKPSYTRRISLGGPSRENTNVGLPTGTDLTYTEDSNVSSLPPVEVEVLQHESDLSSHGGRYVAPPSDISSMPPDSMLELGAPSTPGRQFSQTAILSRDEAAAKDRLKMPARRRSRSLSKERFAQMATEKIRNQDATKQKRISSSSRDESTIEDSIKPRSRREEDSQYLSEVSKLSDQRSTKSGNSMASSINNPKLLNAVEDAIRRLILPELNALKEEQKFQKNRSRFDESARDSYASQSSRDPLERSLSKSSSAPHIRSKPKVVLNRDGDDPGTVLSGDSVKHRKTRRSSRDSTSERSHGRRDSIDSIAREKERAQRKSSRESHTLHDAAATAAAAGVGGGLTMAALKHHDSQTSMDYDEDEKRERRRKRRTKSKSRSRATSVSESYQDEELDQVPAMPPMPFRSELASELTRDSILSADTDRPVSRSSLDTPVREVSRGSPRQVISPTPRTPTRTPQSFKKSLGSYHENSPSAKSSRSLRSQQSDRDLDEDEGLSSAKAAALAAAGIGAAGVAAHKFGKHQEDDMVSDLEYNEHVPRALSPIQSVASYEAGDDYIEPPPQHHRVEAIRSAAATPSRTPNKKGSSLSIDSMSSAESSRIAHNQRRDQGLSFESGREILGEPSPGFMDDTPRPGDFDEWLDQNHKQNEVYRSELDDGSSVNYHRMTASTNLSGSDGVNAAHDVKDVSATPEYVRTPIAVESAVASLHNPSILSVRSSHSSQLKQAPRSQSNSFSGGMINTHRSGSFTKDGAARSNEDHSPSSERWEAIRNHAQSLSDKSLQQRGEATNSPPQSIAESMGADDHLRLGASAFPLVDDPMPEIGYHEDESDIHTNPYEPSLPPSRGDDEESVHREKDAALIGGATAAALGAAAMAHHMKDQRSAEFDHSRNYQPQISDISEDYDQPVLNRASPYHDTHEDYTQTPVSQGTQGRHQDEGYVTGPVGETPEPREMKLFDDADLENFNPADYTNKGAVTSGVEDPFRPTRHVRALSGTSHGMSSPLYDSATGKGMDRIQSKDVVALMDHLTVRDAQRNARDTEILVTLVRSAAEMRNSFEEMKRFIAEQDRMLMAHTDKGADQVVQRVLGGPRPQPMSSPRTSRRASTDDGEDLPARRRNVFKRALKGLSMKNSNDLTNIEGMLMRLLDEVEGLKDTQSFRPAAPRTDSNSLNSYENLRSAPDAGYEPEGHAGTSSTPNQSGYFSNPSSRHLNPMHSGYDGRRGSENRISPVLERDEELDDNEQRILAHQFEENERLLTPTQEARRSIPNQVQQVLMTPPEQTGQFSQSAEQTPKTGERKSKHKSTNSSFFNSMVPRVSRWSKTTASTIPESTRDSQEQPRGVNRPYSQGSQSGSQVNLNYYPEGYQVQDDDRLRSTQSLAREQTAAALGAAQPRSPSPLIPSEVDLNEDPKYHAHRNSLNLQHPQPRPGPTQRHQNQLESQALIYDHIPVTSPISGLGSNVSEPNDHDQWGSNPSLALNRARVPASAVAGNLSPVYSERGYNQHAGPSLPPKVPMDHGPLVPPKVPVEYHDEEPQGIHMYSSPMNSGYLKPLEPIQEVRYSMETDRNLTPSPSVQPRTSMQSAQRKITGPREMPSRSPSSSHGLSRGQEELGTVRRKPVARSFVSLDSYHDTESNPSETF